MSILGALKQMKQQTGSLDELASLPQAMIMQMARSGQIPKEQVLPILNRKAELANTSAKIQATRQAGGQPTVLEQILAAPQQQPQEMMDAGVAQLPIREDMYNEQRMAGGGIVAFENNQDQPVDENMPTTDETNPYLRRSQGVYEAGRQLFNPRNYNPFAKMGDIYQAYQQNIGQPFAGAVNRFINETPEQQADRFRRASQARENIGKRVAGVPTTSEEVRRLAPAEKIIGSEQKLFEDEAAAKAAKPKNAPTVDAAGNIVPNANASKTKQVAAATANAVGDATGAPKPSVYEEMLLKQGEDAAKARQEAKYMRLLEAGLGIMGGTSPYAFTNIGQGAIGAAKGYAEDIKGFRTEERERAKTLGALSMEKEKIAADREKTAMLERRYKEMADVDRQKIGVMSAQNRDEKTARLVGQAFNTLMSEYKTRLDRGEVTPSDLYLQAQQMVSSSLGTNVGGAAAAPANPTFSWSSLNTKAK